MSKNKTQVDIPVDIWESPQEIVVIMPLGGVKKSSLKVMLEGQRLLIVGEREKPQLGEKFVPILQECFWWEFNKEITLPLNVYFDKIVVQLSPENILKIIVPKIEIPTKKELEVEFV